ncbi:CS1 type fimbrial major subunit [Stenotrophomonas forensis]|uniref:Fimbrial protein n=1 Tax=Stenotrophomonas forensis TaxID=2871169 RepID=A0ABY7XZ28_9GAMM|nr:CS1 type fimbrial major subunit [Stenotrophomonas sp. DFS-20110405]WDM62982.1 fimbrial protein [Stenotrophomonas sp. DFS-20110405]
MNVIVKKAALAAALATASLSAHAVDTRISVYANVDTTLAFQQENGSPLPDSITMNYLPEFNDGSGGNVRPGGLEPWTLMTRIFTNDDSKDIQVSLQNALELVPTIGHVGATPVPMTVSLHNLELTTASQDLSATDLFDGAIDGVSKPLELAITQTTAGVLKSGSYEGMATIVMRQKP